MKYLAITEGTASWLLGKAGLLDAVHDLILMDNEIQAELRAAEFVEGPVRISASQGGDVLALWNIDYMSGTGDDGWGFVDIGDDLGLLTHPEVGREVFERALYVVSQRLQGLLIDGAFIHRSWENGAHTCLAGRGTDARRFSIGYIERDILDRSNSVHTVLVLGPEHDLRKLSQDVAVAAENLDIVVPIARRLYDPTRKKLALSSALLMRLRESLSGYLQTQMRIDEFGEVSVPTGGQPIKERESYRTAGWSYRQWLAPGSPLSIAQRRLLFSDAIERHPIRIIGPGGSGKTLLMQLLALRRLELASSRSESVRILYLVHNAKMVDTVKHRFSILLENCGFVSRDRVLDVRTLSEHGRKELGLDSSQIIDPDAHEAKEFQFDVLRDSLRKAMLAMPQEVANSQFFREVNRNELLWPIFVRLAMSEISTSIKGHGLASDERRYVESDRALSRFHGVLSISERRVIFAAFKLYHETVFEGYGVLDSDDVALSLLGKLRTPIWELKRKNLGFDFVFVDEAQLFNENERRVLPLLTKSTTPYVPIILALDEAQDLYGQTSAGLATLGIRDIANESLLSIHRSSKAIIRLAFFVIQRSTDLFGPDFPDFTSLVQDLPEDSDPREDHPSIVVAPPSQREYGHFILKRIRSLRKANLRRIAVICMAEQYWQTLLGELRNSDLPLHVLESRGERLSATDPIVVLSRPPHIGGQEFDAVILVGAEQGLVPPRVLDNDALAAAVEQQALREFYLSITRARHRLMVALAHGSTLSPVLLYAQRAGLLSQASTEPKESST